MKRERETVSGSGGRMATKIRENNSSFHNDKIKSEDENLNTAIRNAV